jgi:PAS domain S-box-containing protein
MQQEGSRASRGGGPGTDTSLIDPERRFELLVQAVTDYAIYMLDTEGYVTSWNSGAEKIKGYTADEIIGQHFSRFFTEEQRAERRPWRALETARKHGRFEEENWRVRKDGSQFWALAVLDAVYDEAGELIGFAKVTRDVTERKEAEARLEEMRSQLLQSQKMEAIGQLTGGVAHDFNNLLMIILGNLESAERQLGDLSEGLAGRLRRAIGRSARAAQRAAALTRRLLAFSRKQALKPEVLDVNKFIADSAEFLRRTLGETIEVVAAGNGATWPIEVDHNELETALLNVAINARDAMPNGGRLTIEVSNVVLDREYAGNNPDASPGQYVLISVTDTGIGMSREMLERAFEPFFTTKPVGEGTGLGLSQVYGFVKQSGGHTKFHSEVGHGTAVKMYFPRLLRDAGSTTSADPAAEVVHGQSGDTILLVEDDPDLRGYLTETLHDLNYRVLVAQDAAAAARYIEQPHIHFDLLLTDVVLPGANGRELADRARGAVAPI